MNAIKNIKDIVYDCLKEPTREKFTTMMKSSIGELDNLDFKEIWSEDAKIAKTILAMANSGFGMIVFGVKEESDGTITPCGLKKLLDKSEIYSKTKKYLPPTLNFDVADFSYENSDYEKLATKKFQILTVTASPEHAPYISTAQSTGIDKDTIYIRRGTTNQKINNTELQKLLSQRIDTLYSNTAELELQEHLDQLKVLYKNINKVNYKRVAGINSTLGSLAMLSGVLSSMLDEHTVEEDNPLYPMKDLKSLLLE